MGAPTDRVYAETHEWHKLEGDILTVGLTQFAADALTDVTFVEMKDAGTDIAAGDSLGEVESVKTTSDIDCPVPGEITEVNEKLEGDPSLVNSDPFGDGWLVKIKVTDAAALDGLMNAEAYDASIAG